VIPRQLHFQEPNPHVPWARLPVQVTREAVPWPEGRRLAGVSSFGFSGTNAHVVLEAAPELAALAAGTLPERGWHVLALSAQSAGALAALAGRYQEWWAAHAEAALADGG